VAEVLFAMMQRFTVIKLPVPLLRIPPALPDVLLFVTIRSSKRHVAGVVEDRSARTVIDGADSIAAGETHPAEDTVASNGSKIRLALLPLIVRRYAPGPAMVNAPLFSRDQLASGERYRLW
jgi:hypothetical protein